VTGCVCEKNAQNVAQPISAKVNALAYPRKKEAKNVCYFCNFLKKTAHSRKQTTHGRKFCQSGHPPWDGP
jgi:hypothetical protein